MAKGKRRALGGGGWRQVAPLVPLALFASAFTVSATDDPAVATAALEQSLGQEQSGRRTEDPDRGPGQRRGARGGRQRCRSR